MPSPEQFPQIIIVWVRAGPREVTVFSLLILFSVLWPIKAQTAIPKILATPKIEEIKIAITLTSDYGSARPFGLLLVQSLCRRGQELSTCTVWPHNPIDAK